MNLGIFNRSMGADFVKFRFGQLISLLGDSCSHIALAWWILDQTGSTLTMSTVMAPPMLLRIFLMPILGPIGDQVSRKKMVIIADMIRFIFTSVLCLMVYKNIFHTGLVTAIFIMISIGTAMFNVAASGIIPSLVDRRDLQLANQQSQAINSLAGVLGGVLGGVVVSTAGVLGAFLFDAVSYIIAGYFTFLIKANLTSSKGKLSLSIQGLKVWKNDLVEGFCLLYKLPVIFWLCVVAMLLNFSLSPFGIVLPMLVKEARGMPAWFLGALETSVSLGAILGAFSIGYIQKYLKSYTIMILSIFSIGMSVMILPWIPNIYLPVTVLFFLGLSGTWVNIPLGTQMSLAVPLQYLSRVGSIMSFMCSGISPIGVAMIGIFIAHIGLQQTMFVMGITVCCLAPLFFLVPNFKDFLNASASEAKDFLHQKYPGVLK